MAKWDLSKLPEGRKRMSNDLRSLNSLEDIEFAVKRIEELEAKLTKAVGLVDDMLEWGTWYGEALAEIRQRLAELKGEK